MTYWRSPSFKAMQEAWYAKLREEGFEDAEELVAGEMMLKQSASHPLRHTDELRLETVGTYFDQLSESVKHEEFRSKTDRIILLLRADGAKIQQIVDTLVFLGKRRCRRTVRCTIRRYEMEWGLREYTPSQLNKRESVKRSA